MRTGIFVLANSILAKDPKGSLLSLATLSQRISLRSPSKARKDPEEALPRDFSRRN
jgi:hypothetical protein